MLCGKPPNKGLEALAVRLTAQERRAFSSRGIAAGPLPAHLQEAPTEDRTYCAENHPTESRDPLLCSFARNKGGRIIGVGCKGGVPSFIAICPVIRGGELGIPALPAATLLGFALRAQPVRRQWRLTTLRFESPVRT